MLSWIRKKKGSRALKLLLLGVAVTFLGGFGVVGYLSDWVTGAGDPNAVASVAGVEIGRKEFTRRMYNMRSASGEGARSDEERALFKQRILNDFITDTLIIKTAKDLGLTVSKIEIQNRIKNYFLTDQNGARTYVFLQNGKFDNNTYNSYLTRIGITPEDFETTIERRLLISKMVGVVTSQVSVDDAEVMDEYVRQNTKVSLQYVAFDPQKIEVKGEMPDEALQEYFGENEADFFLNETRKIEYVLISIEDARKSLKITDGDVKSYYEDNKDREYTITPKEVRARHILIKPKAAGTPDEIKKEDEAALAKAMEIYEKATAPDADFAALAAEFSDDPGSKVKGGDLGFFKAGAMVKPFEEAAFSTQPGEITKPVKSDFGYHLIKVEEVKKGKYKKLKKKLKKQIRKKILESKAPEKTRAVAEDIQERMDGGAAWEDAAAANNLEIRSSDFFQSRELKLGDIRNAYSIVANAFKTEKDELSDPITVPNIGTAILKVVEIKEPHQAEFDEVKEMVREKLLTVNRKKKALEMAERMLRALKEGKDFEKLAKKKGVEVKETPPFTMQYGIIPPDIGLSEPMSIAAFMLDNENPYPEKTHEVLGKFYAFKLESREEADVDALDETKKKELSTRLLATKQNEVYKKWSDNLKAENQHLIDIKDLFYTF